MKKVPKPIETKPMKVLNKSILPVQQISSQKHIQNTSRCIDDPQKLIRCSLNKQQILLMIKDELITLQTDNNEIKQQLKNITEELYEERNLNSQIISNLKTDIELLTQKIEIKHQRHSILNKSNIENKRIALIQSNITTIFQKLDQVSQNRFSINTDQKHIQQLNNLNNDVEGVGIQMRCITRQIQREVAQLHDSFLELEQTVHIHINTVGDKMRLSDLQKALNSLTDKVSTLTISSQKSTSDLQKVFRQLQHHQISIQKYLQKQQKLKIQIDNNINQLKQFTQNQSNDLQQFLSNRLGKMIESYNHNFDQMDRSINELKDTVKQVLYINRLISDNLGHKLKNIIDNNTFNQTITNLHQKFNETYMLNHQKIQELNSKEFEVQNQLNYMKDILEHLKSDIKQSCNNKVRLAEEVSMNSSSKDSNCNLEGSTEFERMRVLFRKPSYVFPERDSFNYTEEKERKKRRSIGVEEDNFGIRLSKEF